MSRIITKRIIPILLLVMLCIGMFPTAFAEEEIMIADTPAATQIEVVQDSSDADITIVPNEDAGDLIADEGPDSAPVDESSSSGADFSSTGSSEVPAPSSSEASSPSCAVSDSAISSSSEIVIPDSSSTSSTSVVSADESETIPEETGTSDEKVPAETSVEIVRMRGASLLSASAASAGKLSWTKHPEYQYDASQGLSSVDMQPWPTATINGQIAYCVQPENLNTHGSKPYAPIQYDHLSSTQRYAIGYAMLYGAQDTGNIPFHIATQTIIWEIVHGYMDAKPSLEITKVDADDPAIKLEGAAFRIAQRGSKDYQDITTGPDGVARLTGMEPDYYVVTEITAPNGYILSDEEHTVEIVEGQVTTITLSNQKKPSLSILKTDSVTEQPLANATFEIGYKNGETIGRFTSDEDGFVHLPQINPGLIVVTEITAPDGYIIDLQEQEVLLNPGEEKTLRFENTPASPIILKKVDMEGTPLTGAMFRLTKMNGELVGEYTTGRNGFVTVPELNPGWYVAVESKAPDGYKLNSTPQKVELKAGEPAILEFENEELPHLQIYKYDSVAKKPLAGVTIRVEKLDGERIGDFKTNQAGLIAIPELEPGAYVCYEIATVPGYQLDMTPQTVELDADGRGYVEFANIPLAGLTLQKIDGVTNAGIGGVEFLVTKLDGGEIGVYTTDGNGRIFIPYLEEQYVRVREIRVPDGYKLDTTEKIVELKAGEANAVEFENHPYPYLVIYKLGDDGQPLPGVSFKITNDAGRELGTYTTNSAGRIVLTGIDEGHYVVQEAEAAEGYELDATPYDVYLQWGKTTQIKLKNKELGSLSLVKVSAENEKQVLPGASFLLYDEKGSLIGEYTTDENGEILLDHVLKAGIYTLKEIKAPDGFVLDEQTQKVEIKNGATIRLTCKCRIPSISWPPRKHGLTSRRAGFWQ